MLYVVAYDIPEDRRRTRVAKEMENWGVRVQYSLFECELDSKQAAELMSRLTALTVEEDRVRVYRLCGSCWESSVVVRGKEGIYEDPDFYQV